MTDPRDVRRAVGEYLRSVPLERFDAYCKCGHPDEAHDTVGMCWLPACGCAVFRLGERQEP